MNTVKDERKLLFMAYFLTIALFGDLALLKDPIDIGALIMGGVVLLLIAYAHFVVRKFFPDGDKFLLIFAVVLAAIGIAVLYRLNTQTAIKQVIWFVLGITSFVLITVLLPDFKRFYKYKYYYLGAVAVFMPMALLIGKVQYGAKNWVIIGPISIQPSEIGKIFLILYLGASLKDYVDKKNLLGDAKQLIEPALVSMASIGCMVLQRDLGSALLFFGITVTMLYVASSKVKYVLICLVLFAAGAVASYYLFGHVRERVIIWQNIWQYANDESYQIVQGLFSISSGGMFGTGLGQGYPAFVPVNTSDYIFAIICEEFGMVFGIGILIIYFLLFYRGMRAAIKVEDRFSQLAAVGFSAMIASQVLVIIGGVFAVIPLTGITLPLISAGGSSMLTIFLALGMIQKISEEG
ncbi:FtsW/RodA/SpoVE family cell cycle protein [Clostridium sp. 'White wine YQ']|uniref:FtsW/RodA/SpoVE family cell cycle protein n=1 Tax=Clostridium sp. 'White wine YQ' TaxID=3027474 RepID=UPI0023667CD4|nr:FtsW/RodA/SpoVE family cell cycle protein [Clostridium sp. 'White wine YQ']MDD7795644.1 FtsW/RodA/SpoVE family cell cycle protein [Clostridium sp. 'White wine YQ']